MIEFLSNIMTGRGFPARWDCGGAWRNEPWWGWIHIFSDVAIWLAYFAIPMILIRLSRRRRDLPFPMLIGLFATFILACGTTHLMDAVIFYWPAYRLAGLLKLLTATVSVATVIALFEVIPKALMLKSPEEAEREIATKTADLRELANRLSNEIEARNRIDSELRTSRELLQLAMTAGDTGFFDWNLIDNELRFDPSEVRLTGLGLLDGKVDPEEFFERIGIEDRDMVRQRVQQALEAKADYQARFRFLRPDGKLIWLNGRGCVIRGIDGKPQRFIGLNQDVTEQVQREKGLDAAAQEARLLSEQKSRFIAQVSHEIRTPLAAMLGCIDSLLMDLSSGDTRETLRVVRSQGELLQILLNDVLDISKMEAGRLTIRNSNTDVASLFADVCSLMDPLAAEKGLNIHWISESKLPNRIVCDSYRLRQVMVNLIGNAIKFTERGTISIVARIDQPEHEPAEFVIEVRDTGFGIPKSKLDVIFEEYEQLSVERTGTGLGLAICKRLVGMMGGKISVRSELGIGSAFTVKIPLGDLSNYELVPLDQIASTIHDGYSGYIQERKLSLRVLAAEDTRAIQFVLKRLLGNLVESYQVVGNGQEAVEQVMLAEHSGAPFDLVLMDIQMPVVDGTEATRQLRREQFTKPIVALTAGAMESERTACMAAGCTHFLPKPINLNELKKILVDVAELGTQESRLSL